MTHTRTTAAGHSALALLGIVCGLALPALAQADPATTAAKGSVPKVLDGAKAPLSPADAARAQAKSKKAGRFPAPPKFATHKGLRRTSQSYRSTRPLPRNGKSIPRTSISKPSLREGKLFGYVGTFDSKRLVLFNWVNYVYRINVPKFGGTFRQPSVYELPSVGTTPNGCPVSNLVFCWGGTAANTVAWSAEFWRAAFDRLGDGAAAAFLAHEYGHGTMYWMGWTGRGKFRYELYSEGFADCMAGGWMYWMYANGYTDGLGQGDTNEMLAGLDAVADQSTDFVNYTGHGDRTWRRSAGYYGWNYGFNGCIAWGRSIAAGTAG